MCRSHTNAEAPCIQHLFLPVVAAAGEGEVVAAILASNSEQTADRCMTCQQVAGTCNVGGQAEGFPIHGCLEAPTTVHPSHAAAAVCACTERAADTSINCVNYKNAQNVCPQQAGAQSGLCWRHSEEAVTSRAAPGGALMQ